jgi:NAD(P)-dependent dehydrogenase (short-subunit alcohol dehydrogenase family)
VLQDRDFEGDLTDLTAQRASVIGGSSGAGIATAKALCESGLEVVVTARDEAKLEAARQTLGLQGRAERGDAISEEEVRAFFQRSGSFDHLAASTSPERPIPRHPTRRDVTARPREPPQATGTA